MDHAGDRDHQVSAPRGATSREWEVFLRDEASDPLKHAGSVSAPSVEVARDQAHRLFGWASEALWLCPADAVARFQTADLTLAPDEVDEEGTDA